jgi:chitodextrinase
MKHKKTVKKIKKVLSYHYLIAILVVCAITLGGIKIYQITTAAPVSGCQPDPSATIEALKSGAVWNGNNKCYTTPQGINLTKPVTLENATFIDTLTSSPNGPNTFGLDPIIQVYEDNNVTLTNLTLRGEHVNPGYSHRLVGEEGLKILSSSNVTVNNVNTINTFGDGLYLNDVNPSDRSPDSNVVVNGMSITNTGRAGVTVAYADGCTLNNIDVVSAADNGWDFESDIPAVGPGYITINNATGLGRIQLIAALNGPITYNNANIGGTIVLENEAASSGEQVTFNNGSILQPREVHGTPPGAITVEGAGNLTFNNVSFGRYPGALAINGLAWVARDGAHINFINSPVVPPPGVADSMSKVTIRNNAPQPSTPQHLTISKLNKTQALLSWGASNDSGGPGLGGYHIMNGNGNILVNAGIDATSATVSGLKSDSSYIFTVVAFDKSTPPVLSKPSNIVSFTTSAVQPVAPSDLKASVHQTIVTLTWTAGSDTGGPGLGGYHILNSSGETVATAGPTATTATVIGLKPHTQYRFAALDYDTSTPRIDSPLSNTVTITTRDAPAPTPPTNLKAVADGANQINLTWTDSTDVSGITGYAIYRNGYGIGIVPSNTTSFGDTGLSPNTTYSYYIIGVAPGGVRSVASTSASATTASLPPGIFIYGTVKQKGTNRPLASVNVVTGDKATPSGPERATTNPQGFYLLINIIPNQPHHYFFFLYGYQSTTLYTKYGNGSHIQNVSLRRN